MRHFIVKAKKKERKTLWIRQTNRGEHMERRIDGERKKEIQFQPRKKFPGNWLLFFYGKELGYFGIHLKTSELNDF
jgi:hypothetical protein